MTPTLPAVAVVGMKGKKAGSKQKESSIEKVGDRQRGGQKNGERLSEGMETEFSPQSG